MKRVLYSIPIFLLLLPWLAATTVVLWIGFVKQPSALLLLFPMGFFLWGAGYVHRRRVKLGQDIVASMAASAVLAAPWFAIIAVVNAEFRELDARYPLPAARPYVPAPAPEPLPTPRHTAVELKIEQPPAVEERATAGWLGVEIETLDASHERSVGLAKGGGVLIVGLQEDRPAQDAGFRPGDIVVKFGGVRMLTAEQLRESIHATGPGTRVRVRAMRGDADITLKPTIESKYGERGCAPWPCY